MTVINQAVMSESDIIRPTHLEIDLDVLGRNYAAIKQHVNNRRIMTILKANAYGHGLVVVGQYLEHLGADYFGVAFLEEGIMLREAGIQTPILVLGGILDNQVPLFIKYDLTLTASSVEKLAQIETAAERMGKRAKVHLKIDTGMERIGVHYYSADTLLEASCHCQWSEIEAIYTHFASSDSADLSYTHLQLQRFNKVLNFYTTHAIKRPMVHIANSGAILQMPDAQFDMVRAGILLYGVYPDLNTKRSIPVEPALTWRTRVVYFKVVMPGHPVSYGSTWQSAEMVRVVTLPIGYGDGYFRAMSDQAEVIIRGKRYPVVGRICMDQMMINIGWESAYNGDEVILMGKQGGVGISAEELAKWANTIPYEILTNINTRVPRRYVGGV
ncbi:MAG: alanine racemase [Candidatus Promineifilaceae bacterium]